MWQAAKALNRDPLEALGVTGSLTPEQAAFTLTMQDPRLSQEHEEMREATSVQASMQAEEAWEAALPGGTGYRGPRSSEVNRGG